MNAARNMWGCTRPEPATASDRADPPVGGAPVETSAVASAKDRALDSFTDREVDGAAGARHQRNHRRFRVFTDDLQGPVAALEAEVLDVGGTCFADP